MTKQEVANFSLEEKATREAGPSPPPPTSRLQGGKRGSAETCQSTTSVRRWQGARIDGFV